jgi:hypothetical protein
MALAPQPITDQITGQNTPYCDELDYVLCDYIRVLAVIPSTILALDSIFVRIFDSTPDTNTVMKISTLYCN